MSKKKNITSLASLRASVGAFWGNKKADLTSDFNFYKSYLAYKHGLKDWMAMKLAKEDKKWILAFYNKKSKKSKPPSSEATSAQTKKPQKRKLEKIQINQVRDAAEVKYLKDKTTVFVDAGTKNNGQKGRQETTIACVDGSEELIFDRFIGDCTNNQGEIRAIVEILKEAKGSGYSLNIYSDSMIAIGWATRGLTKGSPENDTYAAQAKELIEKTASLISWVPRDINLAGVYLEEKYQI